MDSITITVLKLEYIYIYKQSIKRNDEDSTLLLLVKPVSILSSFCIYSVLFNISERSKYNNKIIKCVGRSGMQCNYIAIIAGISIPIGQSWTNIYIKDW